MLGKKPKKEELTTDDAPDSIAPWEMLDDDEMASATISIQERQPHFKVVGRHQKTGDLVCFDKGPEGTGKAVVLVSHETAEIKQRYTGFGEWFDQALKDHQKWKKSE